MKPSFALDLRDEQVVLLHRTSRGWQEVGQTRFDAPDMTEALAYMRSTALGLSPRGISTKIILPNDQILFTQVAAPGPDAAKRKKQVRAGLEGLTPYALDDLVFDTHGSGPEVQVAAVAKETLDQAEAFAAEHRFNPVSFVAVPDNGLYLSEPFFGPSRMSPALLSDGEKVERDSTPVHVVPREMPRSAASAVPEQMAEPVSEPVAADVAPDSVPQVAPETAPETASETAFVAEPVPASAAETAATGPTKSEPDPALRKPEPVLADPARDRMDSDRQRATLAAQAGNIVVPEAPMAVDVENDDLTPPPARPMTAADLKKSLAPVKLQEAVKPQEAVLRQQDDVPAGPSEAVRAALAARRPAGSAPNLGAGPTPSLGAAPAPRPAQTKPLGTGAPPPLSKTPAPLQASKSAAQGKPPKAGEGMVTSSTIPGLGRRKQAAAAASAVPAATSAAAGARPASGAKPMTDLKGRPVQVRGKPRYLGLILTGVLLVFLVLIAAWSSYFLAGLNADQAVPATTAISQAETPQATQPDTTATADAATAATAGDTAGDTAAAASDQAGADQAGADQVAGIDPTVADEAAADGQNAPVAVATGAAPDPALAPTDVAAAATEPAAAMDVAADMAKDVASRTATAAATDAAIQSAIEAATSAETTPTPPAPPPPAPAPGTVVSAEAVSADTQNAGDTGSDEIFLAANEPPTALVDPAALPAVAASDAGPLPSADPPPFGTVYKFDAEGRIVPTPDGIMTPEGVLLVAGAPKPLPPARPAAVAALAPAPAADPAPPDAAPNVAALTDGTAPVGTAPDGTAPDGTAPDVTGAETLAPDAAETAAATSATPNATPGAIPLGLAPALAPGASSTAEIAAPATLPGVSAPRLTPDPDMEGFRPKSRPAGLVPAAASAPDPAASAAPPDPRLASYRPRARATSPLLTAMATSTAGLENAAPADQQTASVLAVASSALPPARPAALAQGVDQAVAAAMTQPQVQVTAAAPAASAAAAPAASPDAGVDEPEVTTPMPKIPTSASVAKVATEKNALAFGKVTLIGIFGADGTRYAYVRMNTGALKKVKVGDQLDGGRVVAISASDLRYQKGGKEVVLAMPRES